MFDTVVITTDGSASAQRAVDVALDFAARFDATVHALYVVDEGDVAGSPETVRDELASAFERAGEEAMTYVRERAGEYGAGEIVGSVREGQPASEIVGYVEEVDADLVVTGTRGRHGEHAFLLGSVAEAVVRRSPCPVLTVRQLDDEDARAEAA